MNPCVRHLAALALGLALAPLAQAQNLPGRSSDHGPIHRANPNSMQGTQPNAPAVRSIQPVPANPRPTLKTAASATATPSRRRPPAARPPHPKRPPMMPTAIAAEDFALCLYVKPC